MSTDNSGRPLAAFIRWITVAAVPTIALPFLLSADSGLALSELANAALEPALFSLGRLVGIALAGWLVTSQLIYTVAVLTGTDWLAQTLKPFTLPLVRRAVAGLATLSLSLPMTAFAQTHTETTTVTVDYTNLRQEATPTPVLEPLVKVQTTAVCVLDDCPGSYSAPLTWLVRPGDNLWRIASEHLVIVLDRAPTRDEHARYWVEVVNTARPIIRSGDPDLIYPGETIPLPPTLDAGVTP